MNNVYTLLRARRERRAYPRWYVRSELQSRRAGGPQPEGARRRAGICSAAAPRICPPGARAKVKMLFIDRPLLASFAELYPKIQDRHRYQNRGRDRDSHRFLAAYLCHLLLPGADSDCGGDPDSDPERRSGLGRYPAASLSSFDWSRGGCI